MSTHMLPEERLYPCLLGLGGPWLSECESGEESAGIHDTVQNVFPVA